MRQSPTTTRRKMFTATGSLAAVLLAGCSARGNEQSEATTTEESTTSTTTASETSTTTTTAEQSGDGEVDREVTVESESFKFTPGSDDPLRLKAGETVKLTATATDDGLGQGHGLGIPELDINLYPLTPDESKSTVFTPQEPGEYEMICTIQCSQPGAGAGHDDMRGTVIVE